jgi:1-acyl-sn-glycerol-3-phosphate acyltransferase
MREAAISGGRYGSRLMGPAMSRILVDHRGAPIEPSTWRTLLAYGSTLAHSGRLAARASIGRLRPRHLDRTLRRWCAEVLAVSHTTLGVEGLERVVPGQAYVLVSNHRSLLDPVAAITAFPGTLSFVAKQELSRVPVFAQAMGAARVVFVDRKNPARAVTQLEEAKLNVRDGISMWVAAEGTRSRDGELGKLKKGAFHVAMALGVPILPTWIDGTGEVLPPDAFACVTGKTVWVVFGEPIPTAGVGRDGLEGLVQQTRRALEGLRGRAEALRGEVRPDAGAVGLG